MLSACHAVDMEFGYETNFWTKLLFSQNNWRANKVIHMTRMWDIGSGKN
jgi:hypothetical protein